MCINVIGYYKYKTGVQISMKKQLILNINLPTLQEDSNSDEALNFWRNIIKNGQNIIIDKFEKNFQKLENEQHIKKFSNLSKKSWYWKNAITTSDFGLQLKNFEPIDLVKDNYYNLCYVSFQLMIPQKSKYAPPISNFINLNDYWKVNMHSISCKKLKTQDNFTFKAFIGIQFPILKRSNLENPKTCNHSFRSLNLGVWEWRLVWVCKKCGFMCYCDCFKKAIEASPYRHEYLHRYSENLEIKVSDLEFISNACDVCRGVESTNQFCHQMYARSKFELQYGAYVRKKMTELKLEKCPETDFLKLQLIANNLVRDELGFPKIGEKWATETKLYKIISKIFSKNAVIHHYRNKWLERLELDIFIPSKNIAIEYHGIQHFKAMNFWGGEKSFLKTKERDKKKERLCKENRVLLIIFTYKDEISIQNVNQRLLQFDLPINSNLEFNVRDKKEILFMNNIPNIVSVSYAKRVLQNIGSQMLEDYQSQFEAFEQTATKTIRDKAISPKNKETNEVANKIIRSESLKDCLITSIYGAFRRLHNALELLVISPDENMFPLMNEKDTYEDMLEFFLFGFDWTSGNRAELYAFPKDEFSNILRKVSPAAWSIYDKKS